MIERYPNYDKKIGKSFLLDNLEKSKKYDRIAGYFCNSILELGVLDILNDNLKIRIICNCDNLTKKDIEFYRNSKKSSQNKIDFYMKTEWDKYRDKNTDIINKFKNPNSKFDKLYRLIKSGNIKIRVIPKDVFFLHGKAGLFVYNDNNYLTFCGSINETYSGYEENYEILWTDNSSDGKIWFENQFNYLWRQGIELSNLIIEDINRIYHKEFIDIEKENLDLTKIAKEHPALILKPSPIYQYGDASGLWLHQADFVELLLKEHFNDGARFLLADMVGLGKTIEVGAFLKIIATVKEAKPILLFVPRPIVNQWQNELLDKFNLPSAIFEKSNGKEMWICKDKEGIEIKETSFKKCPRKIGIISTGYITNNKDKFFKDKLLDVEYECILVDEGHKMRRDTSDFKKNVIPTNPETEDYSTNLYKFIYDMSPKTKSLIIATATPIQLDFTELWDLLHILANKNVKVLGNEDCFWNNNLKLQKDLMTKTINNNFIENLSNEDFLKLIINPLIIPLENKYMPLYNLLENFSKITNDFNSFEAKEIYKDSMFQKIKSNNEYIYNNNPYTYRVIRRTREQLEKQNLMKHIEVNYKLITVSNYSDENYENKYKEINPEYKLKYLNMSIDKIREFCLSLKSNKKAYALLLTLLLRRTSSSIIAGYSTISRMLDNIQNNEMCYNCLDDEDIIEETIEEISNNTNKEMINDEKLNINNEQVKLLKDSLNLLDKIKNNDPKLTVSLNIIKEENLDLSGVIIFSQFYDTANAMFEELIKEFPNENIALYAGGNKSKLYIGSKSNLIKNINKSSLQDDIQSGKIKLVVGTDAASEGLNLQTLSSLINLDLPYNPTKFEQRKGRIFRIGQKSEEITIYNLVYKSNIEDKVISLLKERFKTIHAVFEEYDSDSIKINELWSSITQNSGKKINTSNIKNTSKYVINTTQIKNKKLNWSKENKEILEEQLYSIYIKPWNIR